ncbi:MAG: glycosyltransferase family 2 protein [bacterium]|nr:glycosyltransferase family 2 protein [bacterium]
MKFFSIVIPAYNEEARIGNTLTLVAKYFHARNTKFEVIVVDDGSIDNTIKELENWRSLHKEIRIISNGTNKGKGFAVKQGVLQAKGDYILITDADLSTPIEEIEHLVYRLKNGYDIVIGSRGLKTSLIIEHENFLREIMGKIFNFIIRCVFSLKIHDTQCGFKCFKRECGVLLFKNLKINRFAFDVEILYLAKLMGYKIKEVGIDWTHSKDTKVRLFKDGSLMLFDVFKIFIYYKR